MTETKTRPEADWDLETLANDSNHDLQFGQISATALQEFWLAFFAAAKSDDATALQQVLSAYSQYTERYTRVSLSNELKALHHSVKTLDHRVTPLGWAVAHNNPVAATALLQAGVSVNRPCGRLTPPVRLVLHWLTCCAQFKRSRGAWRCLRWVCARSTAPSVWPTFC
jgi:hypothetical protein